jgi:hypothetical protein
LLFTACVLGHVQAIAGGWQQSISVPMTLEVDSNPTLSSTNSSKLGRSRIVPDYKLTGTFGVDQIGAGLAFQVEQSSDRNVSQARQDPSLYLNWLRQTQIGEFGLATSYQEASTSISELKETGSIVKDGTRKTQSLSGNWRKSVSEQGSLAASADHTIVAYDSGALNNFTNTSLSLNYSYAWSERIDPFFRIAVSRYAPESAVNTSTNNTTLTGGVQFKISESLVLNAQAGTSKVSGAGASTLQGSFALQRTGQSHNMTLEIGRSSSASGVAGGFVESDTVRGSWSFTIDARTHTGLDASILNNKALLSNTMSQVGAWISHELTPRWIGRLNYQYRQRQQSGLSDASSGLLGLSLIYSHPDF